MFLYLRKQKLENYPKNWEKLQAFVLKNCLRTRITLRARNNIKILNKQNDSLHKTLISHYNAQLCNVFGI